MKDTVFFKNIYFIILSSIGGLILSLTGLSIGWMLGTLLLAALLSFQRSTFLKLPEKQQGVSKHWLQAGQCILGIELGQKMNLSIFHIFKEDWMTILIMLLLSIVFSILSGFILWKFSQMDMLTSLFGTAPGGLSAMPSIAEEVGANTAIVSIVQTMRVFLIVLMIPVIVSSWTLDPVNPTAAYLSSVQIPMFHIGQLLWTIILIVTACGGYYIGKTLRFPAPWLVGSMVSVAIIQSLSSSYVGHDMIAWWPHSVIILSQILMGSSIGSRFEKNMFIGLKNTLFVSLVSTISLILAMFLCAYLVSTLTGITFITAALAFAPGGIAEMTTTAVVLHADSTFVLAVQVLRLVFVCVILPPFFRFLHHWKLRKNIRSHVSA
ncbi:AbrB family transcriptional regulator [Ectobacillus funiculus]|uniref:AbrB family transcriptional regulator n=1 Tax=Ectobacillus funiculus TaxID=137993 RepID=A0ABV5WGP6_9BACI